MRISDWSSDVCSSHLRQPVRQQIVGDPCDLVDIGGVVPQAVAHAEKDVHPRNRPGVDLARVGPDLAARGAVRESLADALDRGFIVAAIAGIIEELGLVDDAVEFLMLAPEDGEGDGKSVVWGKSVSVS